MLFVYVICVFCVEKKIIINKNRVTQLCNFKFKKKSFQLKKIDTVSSNSTNYFEFTIAKTDQELWVKKGVQLIYRDCSQ